MKTKIRAKKALMVQRLLYNDEGWRADDKKISIQNPNKNVCVFDALLMLKRNNLSFILTHVFCVNLKKLSLHYQSCSFAEYKSMVASSKLEEVELRDCIVRNENGKILDVADLMKELPNINSFDYTFFFNAPTEVVTPEIMQKLVELPTFPNLLELKFFHIHELFDLEAFGEFIRKNPTIRQYDFFYVDGTVEFLQQITQVKENLILTLPAGCYLNVVANVDEDDA
uniref:DUF38 domain-containing protein n=1 Tax=Panagrolaimus davidi TaxID=227884 RepID=A0A914QIY9_9BILA